MDLPRYYPILSTDLLEKRSMPLVQAASVLLDEGVRLMQIRHKGHYSREIVRQATEVAELCRQAGAQLVINDRADIALLLHAGLHLGQEDLPLEAVRRTFCAGLFVGLSTHNREQILAVASNPDYIALGPIFATGSKENPDPVVGVENLRAWRHLWTGPLVAIGGITRINAKEVIEAGADSLAVIGDAMPDPLNTQALRERTREWLKLLK